MFKLICKLKTKAKHNILSKFPYIFFQILLTFFYFNSPKIDCNTIIHFMNYFELRVTNNIYYHGQIVEIYQIRKDILNGFAITRPLNNEELNPECDIKTLQPIPLSPELCHTMGLKYFQDTNFYKFQNMIIRNYSLNCWAVCMTTWQENGIDIFVKEIRYVHELQNIVYEMLHDVIRIPFYYLAKNPNYEKY